MRTIIYIDGFNLYYGALKNTPYKWLNIDKMCRLLLPRHQIVALKYYTAIVGARSNDPNQPVRQQTYLRALQAIPNLTITHGQFLHSKIRMFLAHPVPGSPPYATVIKTEEKGSDVNIAAHLIHDGHRDLYDAAVVISNDSDLAEAVRIVRYDLGKIVGMLNPHKRPSYALKQHVSFVKAIRQGVLAKSQFPDTLRDVYGVFHKPADW